MRVGVLGSGSGGNAVVIESGQHRLLIDAGFSCTEIVKRMRRSASIPRRWAALVLTHEHQDHCKGARRFVNRFKLPVYGTAGTLASAGCATRRSGPAARSAPASRARSRASASSRS